MWPLRLDALDDLERRLERVVRKHVEVRRVKGARDDVPHPRTRRARAGAARPRLRAVRGARLPLLPVHLDSAPGSAVQRFLQVVAALPRRAWRAREDRKSGGEVSAAQTFELSAEAERTIVLCAPAWRCNADENRRRFKLLRVQDEEMHDMKQPNDDLLMWSRCSGFWPPHRKQFISAGKTALSGEINPDFSESRAPDPPAC